MTQFNIGDTIYRAETGRRTAWITCPECFGSGRLRVILGNDSEVSIACVCCERGYEGSPGKIQTYEFSSNTAPHVVTGVSSQLKGSGLEIHYHVGCWSLEEKDCFSTHEEALLRASELVAQNTAEEKKRLGYKEKQHKTWASNVAYWRADIRRAKEVIARCESRLAVAPKNPKSADAE